MKLLFALILALLTHQSFADDTHELSGSTQSILGFSSRNTFTLDSAIEYSFKLHPNLQLSTELAFDYSSQSNQSSSVFYALAGPTLNIPIQSDDLMDAFFVTPEAGIAIGDSSRARSQTKFAYKLMVGKRFKLTDHISYRPELYLFKMSDVDMYFYIVPFSFSLFF